MKYTDIAYKNRNVLKVSDFEDDSNNNEKEILQNLVSEVQQHLAKEHENILYEVQQGNKEKAALETIIDEFISKKQSLSGLSQKEAIKKIIDILVGWERLQPLIDDPNITDIFTNEDLEVIKRVNGKDKVTNISFESDKVLEQYIKNLAQKANEKINYDKCTMDGFDPVSNVRIQAGIYGSAVRKGEVVRKPYLTLRKYVAKEYSEEDFIENGTLNREIANFYKEYIEDATFMIVGEPEAGKSTHLDYLQKLKDPMRRTIRIEEEPELSTHYKNSVSFIERKISGEEVRVSYDMAEFAKISTRLSGKDVVIGEVRGKEAWYLFRLLDMGYRGSYSIHGDSCQGGLEQTAFLMSLENPNLTYTQIMRKICRSVDFATYVSSRKVIDIAEVQGYDAVNDKPILNYIFSLELDENNQFYWKIGQVSPDFKKKIELRKKLKERSV